MPWKEGPLLRMRRQEMEGDGIGSGPKNTDSIPDGSSMALSSGAPAPVLGSTKLMWPRIMRPLPSGTHLATPWGCRAEPYARSALGTIAKGMKGSFGTNWQKSTNSNPDIRPFFHTGFRLSTIETGRRFGV